MSDVRILAANGSLRAGSVNAATMRAAVANPPEGVVFEVIDLRRIPLYNGDVEEAGVPEPVRMLVETLAAADGMIFFSPEYNASFPAVTKNAIDWISRPPRAWQGKGMTLVATTPGSRAGIGVRAHFDEIMAHFPVRHFPALGIGSYRDLHYEDGELADPATIERLRSFVADFAALCAAIEEPADD